MATKRKRDDDKPVTHSADAPRTLLSSAITSYESAEVALLHIMKTHDFNTSLLQQILTEDRIVDVSLSNRPARGYRSFRHCQCPYCISMTGPLIEHQTEEVPSEILVPASNFYTEIYNRLIAVFGVAFRNQPESAIEGHITTEGRVEYYFNCNGTNVNKERLDAIAQVIAECDACDWNNAQQGFRVSVYDILCNKDVFELFLFDGTGTTTEPSSLKRGLGPNDPPTRLRPFRLPDPADTLTTRPFIGPICEIIIIFDLLPSGYVSSLKAYHSRSVNKSARECQPRKSVEKWEEAMSAAVRASQEFRDAETKRQTQLADEANSIVEEAMASLKRTGSVDAIPILHKPELIMSGRDNKEIEKRS